MVGRAENGGTWAVTSSGARSKTRIVPPGHFIGDKDTGLPMETPLALKLRPS
jgi:hypothetical protein